MIDCECTNHEFRQTLLLLYLVSRIRLKSLKIANLKDLCVPTIHIWAQNVAQLENNDCVVRNRIFMVLFRNQRLLFWSENCPPRGVARGTIQNDQKVISIIHY